MRKKKKCASGFSLVEMMIALFVGALLIMISYLVLTTYEKEANARNRYVSAQQNARIALDTLEKDIRLAGLNIDDFNVGTDCANLHACGLPPGSPTSLTAVDTPKDAGKSITLDFSGSYDEICGEEDVFNYSVYRRQEGGAEWICIGAITPTGIHSYSWNDVAHALSSGPEPGVAYYYLVTAWDCLPQESNSSNIASPVKAVVNGP